MHRTMPLRGGASATGPLGRCAWVTLAVSMTLFSPGCGDDGNTRLDPPDAGTDADIDSTPPRLLSSSPADGSEDVPRNVEAVRLVFDEALDLNVLPEVPIEVSAGGTSIAFWWDATDEGTTLRLHPFEPLPEAAPVTIRIGPGLADRTGNATEDPIDVTFHTALDRLVAQPDRVFGPPGHEERVELLWGPAPLRALGTADASWRSEDDAVATVTPDGSISLVAPGTTRIVASARGREVYVEVRVHERTAPGFPLATDPAYPECTRFDLTRAGMIVDGGCDRFDAQWSLSVDGAGYEPPMGSDGEPLPPELRAPFEGPAPAMFVGEGQCQVHSLGGAGAWQSIDLRRESSATLTFWASASFDGTDPWSGRAGWKLLLIDAAGTESTLVEESWPPAGPPPPATRSVDLTPWAGQQVRIGWVVEGAPRSVLRLDDISVRGGSGAERFAGGDCGTQDPAWEVEGALIPREAVFPEVESSSRPGIFVQRRIYAPYFDPTWIRYYDTFENRTDTTLTLQVVYGYDVGPSEPAWIPMRDGALVFEVDGDGDDPGVAMMLGSGYSAEFRNDRSSGGITWELTLEPGQKVALLTYHVYLFTVEVPDPDDLTRAERFYDAIVSRAGAPFTGLSSEDVSRVVNWLW